MKNAFLVVLLLSAALETVAQWTTGTPFNTAVQVTNGNVGIGTTTPRGKFDVSGLGDIYLSGDPIGGNTQSLYLPGHIFIAPYNGGNISYLQARRSDNSGTTELQFRTFNSGALTTAMHIKGNGNVGIGTTDPTTTLEVRRSMTPAGQTVDVANFTIAGENHFDGTNIFSEGKIVLASKAYSNNIIRRAEIGYSSSGSWYGGMLKFYTTPPDGTDIPLVRMTINHAGNVGIGTTSPTAKLEVAVSGKSGLALSGNSANYFGADLYIARTSTTADIAKGVVIQLSDEGSGKHNIIQTSSGGLQFCNYYNNSWIERMRLTTDGNVGIGTTAPDAKLAVKGVIHTQEVRVDMTGAMVPDYVFEKDYDLPTLADLEAYIKVNKHLPEVPSACVVEENGVNLGEMNMLLLKKVEELTLYLLAQNKKIEKQQEELNTIKQNLTNHK